MGIWQQVSSLFVGSTDPSQSAALAQENPDVREVVSEVRRLRALPSEQRVLPSGRLGEAVTELLAGVERLSDPEVLRLHFAHICMYPAGLSSPPSGISLSRLAEIAVDRKVDPRWRAGAVMDLSRLGPAAAFVAPTLCSLLDEFPIGAYTSRDRDLLCATTAALCSIGEAAAPFLPRLLAVFDHPTVQADDRMSCPFGSVSIRAYVVKQLAPLASTDERITAVFEQCLFDEDVSLQLAAVQALTRSRETVERRRAVLLHALKAMQAVLAREGSEDASGFVEAARESACLDLIKALSAQ